MFNVITFKKHAKRILGGGSPLLGDWSVPYKMADLNSRVPISNSLVFQTMVGKVMRINRSFPAGSYGGGGVYRIYHQHYTRPNKLQVGWECSLHVSHSFNKYLVGRQLCRQHHTSLV